MGNDFNSKFYYHHLVVAAYWQEFKQHSDQACTCYKTRSSCFIYASFITKNADWENVVRGLAPSQIKEGKRVLELYYKLKGVKAEATL